MKNNFQFHIISLSTYGHGLSGGDRVWIELSKRIGIKYTTKVYVWEEGLEIAKREKLTKVKYVLWSAKNTAYFGFFLNYFFRILIGVWQAFKLNLDNSPKTIIYSASEFWQDSLPALILKLRYPKIKWVAGWYQSAPNPFKVKYHFRAFLYWLVQLPIKPLIKKFAYFVIVNNDNEKGEFPEMNKKNKVFVMLGAVDLDKIKAYQTKHQSIRKIYDGVFQGRFHPQKGVAELIDIWKLVVNSKPDAKLAMIGDGSLMEKVKKKIKNEKLESNVELFGYLFDGEEKYRIFSQSKVVVHPAFYDSGGMASAEAIAFGIPVVGFDLVAYKSYYPKGMVKAKVGDLQDFAKQVLFLLDNPRFRTKIGKEGLRMLESNWSWQTRADNLIRFIS